MSITVTVSKAPPSRPRSSSSSQTSTRPPISLDLEPSTTTEQLYKDVASQLKKSVHRLRIATADKKQTIESDPLTTLASLNISNGEQLTWKDLGPQISWKGVFILEYLGPLLIHPLFFHYGHDILYRFLPKGYASVAPITHSKMQIIAYGMVMLHFLKRELETLFVHRFSHSTMPFFNLFKNCGHYWGLSGLLLAVPLYGPWYSLREMRGSLRAVDEYLFPVAGVWVFAQVSNLITHIILRNLRPANDLKKRQIPTGYGFDRITCPNYFFEVISWGCFTALTMDPFAAVFWAVGTTQMIFWAKKKHRNYKKEFGDKYPKDRWAMIPGIM